jgi:hypothetical protein
VQERESETAGRNDGRCQLRVPADRGEQVEKGHMLPPFSLRNFPGTRRRVQCVGHCRSGFTTLPPVPLPEQYRCGSFVGGAQIARGVGYPEIRWTRRFMWFGPPERNTLRPRVKRVVLLCLSAQLRSSLFSPLVRACGVPRSSSPVTIVCPNLLYPKAGQLQGDPMARQVAPGLVDL